MKMVAVNQPHRLIEPFNEGRTSRRQMAEDQAPVFGSSRPLDQPRLLDPVDQPREIGNQGDHPSHQFLASQRHAGITKNPQDVILSPRDAVLLENSRKVAMKPLDGSEQRDRDRLLLRKEQRIPRRLTSPSLLQLKLLSKISVATVFVVTRKKSITGFEGIRPPTRRKPLITGRLRGSSRFLARQRIAVFLRGDVAIGTRTVFLVGIPRDFAAVDQVLWNADQIRP
jgi:hypothetical protein